MKELNISTTNVSKFAIKRGIKGCFTPLASLHMGSVCERVELIMYNIIKKTVLNKFQRHTGFTENGHIVNNRPITYAGKDASDLQLLTLTHFLSVQNDVGKYLHVKVNNKNKSTLRNGCKSKRQSNNFGSIVFENNCLSKQINLC